MAAIQHQHWRERAITHSEVITDAYEVAKIWAGRAADWILFFCLIADVIEILPGVTLSLWFTNSVLGTQTVVLDIAGLGLATMARQASDAGQPAIASKARKTAYTLIGLMLITVISVSSGQLWPVLTPFTDGADKFLILVRVGMTVWYGHVLHELRGQTMPTVPTPVILERLEVLTHRLNMVQQSVTQLRMPEPLNYATLAHQIIPFLPKQEAPNYEQIVALVAQHLEQQHATTAASLAALQATLEGLVGATKKQQTCTEECNIVAIADYREEPQHAPRRATKRSTSGATNAKQKALRLLQQSPNLDAPTLAKKARISRQYASKIIAELSS